MSCTGMRASSADLDAGGLALILPVDSFQPPALHSAQILPDRMSFVGLYWRNLNHKVGIALEAWITSSGFP